MAVQKNTTGHELAEGYNEIEHFGAVIDAEILVISSDRSSEVGKVYERRPVRMVVFGQHQFHKDWYWAAVHPDQQPIAGVNFSACYRIMAQQINKRKKIKYTPIHVEIPDPGVYRSVAVL